VKIDQSQKDKYSANATYLRLSETVNLNRNRKWNSGCQDLGVKGGANLTLQNQRVLDTFHNNRNEYV
jgi:hypothetical protein